MPKGVVFSRTVSSLGSLLRRLWAFTPSTGAAATIVERWRKASKRKKRAWIDIVYAGKHKRVEGVTQREEGALDWGGERWAKRRV